MSYQNDTLPARWWENPYDLSMSLKLRINEVAQLHGDRNAILSAHGKWITYNELHSFAKPLTGCISHALDECSGPVICLVGFNVSVFVCIISVINANADFSFLDPSAPVQRNIAAAQSINAKLLIVDNDTKHLGAAFAHENYRIINIDDCPSQMPKAPTNPQNLAPLKTESRMIIFTSGSTGIPKGVIRTYSSLLHTQYNKAVRLAFCPSNIMLMMGTPSHVGTVNNSLGVLLSGHAVICIQAAQFDASRIWDSILKYNVTIASIPPSLLRIFLNYKSTRSEQSSLQLVLTSGEAINRNDVSLFYRAFDDSVRLQQHYGSTECGHVFGAIYSKNDVHGTGPLLLAADSYGVDAKVVDSQGGQVPAGTEGELCIRSLSLAEGYTSLYQSEANGFGKDDQGRFFMTGDRAILSEDNKFAIKGRKDRQANINGVRLELCEVENMICSLPNWSQAAVVVLHADSQSQSLGAVVCPTKESEPSFHSLRKQLKMQLPDSAVPLKFILQDRLPRTVTGKTDFNAVTKLFDCPSHKSLPENDPPEPSPSEHIERWLSDAWQEAVRSKTRPSRTIEFDDYGGDSLSAISLCIVLSQQFGAQIDLDFITQFPTIAEQSEIIQSGDFEIIQNRFVLLKESHSGPAVFLLPGNGGHAWVFRSLARELNDQNYSLIAMNYRVGGDCDPSQLHQDQLAIELIEYLKSTKMQNQRIYLAGYSLGAIVASGVANALYSSDKKMKIHGLLLLDPNPLFSKKRYKKLLYRLKWRVRNYLSGAGTDPFNKSAQKKLDLEISRTSNALGKYYRPSTVSLKNQQCRVLLTEGNAKQISPTNKIFDRRFDPACITIINDLQHFDILRMEGVKQSAEWIHDQIVDLDASSMADAP